MSSDIIIKKENGSNYENVFGNSKLSDDTDGKCSEIQTSDLKGIESKSLEDTKKFTCTICQRRFNRLQALKCHFHSHSKGLLFEAPIESNLSDDTKKVTKIIHIIEKPPESSVFKCNICPKTFKTEFSLQEHNRVHTNEKPFRCKTCLKEFSRMASLSVHYRVHTTFRPHVCDVCSKGFKEKQALVKHKKTHTGHKPYLCGTCQKGFVFKRDMERHSLIHTGQKPYACDICRKRFYDKSYLKLHLRTHTDEMPYVCEICQKKFKTRAGFRNHYRSNHSD